MPSLDIMATEDLFLDAARNLHSSFGSHMATINPTDGTFSALVQQMASEKGGKSPTSQCQCHLVPDSQQRSGSCEIPTASSRGKEQEHEPGREKSRVRLGPVPCSCTTDG